MDYECAGYTKWDKPKNAYDTIHMFLEKGSISKELGKELLDICHSLGIDHSYLVTEDVEGMKILQEYTDVSEEDILAEIIKYVSSGRTSYVVADIIAKQF